MDLFNTGKTVTKKRTWEAAVHFNREPHNLCDFSFTDIEQIHNTSDVNSDDKHLWIKGGYWSTCSCAHCSLRPSSNVKLFMCK